MAPSTWREEHTLASKEDTEQEAEEQERRGKEARERAGHAIRREVILVYCLPKRGQNVHVTRGGGSPYSVIDSCQD